MIYHSLKACVLDLEKNGHLIRISEEVDPYLEMAEIHRRVQRAGGPAVFYERVRGSSFPAVSNLFGSEARAQFLFRHTLDKVKKIVQLKANPTPAQFLKSPWSAFSALNMLPQSVSGGPVLHRKVKLSELPQIQSWPQDGGPFVLLPQVYTEDPEHPDIFHSNLGMYRIQMAGNDYLPEKEVGLHYQIRRDIGIHHAKAVARKEPLKVSIFIGGPPAHSFAAVMYLPEGLSELTFAGGLAGYRFRYTRQNGYLISVDADFCMTGTVDPNLMKPEGPFGDHLGYYSLQHLYPVLKIDSIYARKDAIWPFTIVGRPPQEDSFLGKLVHEIAGPMIPKEIPGVKAVHAVDACGVHPLLLAIGSERYLPYQQDRKPQELLTLANALLGYGPCALAKYLMIIAGEDNPGLDIHDVPVFLQHLLERIDWANDLHFQTRTTIDTLDYSGTGLNAGSKVVMAAAGKKRRELLKKIPADFRTPEGFTEARVGLPGIMVLQGEPFRSYETAAAEFKVFSQFYESQPGIQGFPLFIISDNAFFTAENLENLLWTTFTRSNPSHDLYGIDSFNDHKHWGCHGPLVIDARLKPHHAPPLEADPAVKKKVNELFLRHEALRKWS